MGVRKNAVAAAIALTITVVLAGCAQATPGEREVRATVAAMKYKTYGRVLCTYAHGSPVPFSTVGYQNDAAISGTDRGDDLVSALRKLGYRVDRDISKPSNSVLYGPKDVEALVTLLDSSHQGKEWQFDDSESCRVPADGMTVVSLSE